MSEFVECDTCRAKPGTPTLCADCVLRRMQWSEDERKARQERGRWTVEESTMVDAMRKAMSAKDRCQIEVLVDGEWQYEANGTLEYCLGFAECSKQHGHRCRIRPL